MKVAIKCRPFIGELQDSLLLVNAKHFNKLSNSFVADKEKQDGCSCVVEVDGPQTTIKNPNGSKVTTFTYDYSYFQDAKSVNYHQYAKLLL